MNRIQYATFSECGVRRDNEDYCQVVANPDEDRYLFVVCDGMGGHAMGEVASYVVCKTICDYWQQASYDDGVESVLKASCGEASKALNAKADVLNHVEMGTTMVLAAICGNQVTIAHAGDSRCYLLRPDEGVIYQTKDHINHSVFGDFIDRSFFSYQSDKANVELRQFKLKHGDRLFLCTDGVWQHVAPYILTDRLMDDKTPEGIADVLSFLAERSSQDNFTGIVVLYE